jgi:hypothetical protein
VIRVFDVGGTVTETHEYAGDFKECEPCKTVGFPNGFGEILHFLDFYVAAEFLFGDTSL